MTKRVSALLAVAGYLWIAPCHGQSEPAPAAEQKPGFDPRKVQQMLDEARARRAEKTISMTEVDVIVRQLKRCWSVPATNNKIVVGIRVKLKSDGSLDGEPQVVTETKDEFSRKVARSAAAAIALCQPFRLSEANYENWKELDIHFATEDLSQPKTKPDAKSSAAKPGAKPETKPRQ